MIIKNIDAANILRIDIGFIGDRTNYVTWHNFVYVTHLDTEALHAFFRWCVFTGALRPVRALRTFATVASARLIIAACFPCFVGAWYGLVLKQ